MADALRSSVRAPGLSLSCRLLDGLNLTHLDTHSPGAAI
jgi:hypothetical protein